MLHPVGPPLRLGLLGSHVIYPWHENRAQSVGGNPLAGGTFLLSKELRESAGEWGYARQGVMQNGGCGGGAHLYESMKSLATQPQE
jgi:hypothetical protein